MKTGIVICTRYQSRRLPGKVLKKINGKPLLWHLLDRLVKIQTPIILAVPPEDLHYFRSTIRKYGEDIEITAGNADCPLERMYRAAKHYELDNVIRVTTDKIFIDPDCVAEMLNAYMSKGLDYAYSSNLPAGAGFEIIKTSLLAKAAEHYHNVEHISYAVKAITTNRQDVELKTAPKTDARFLIDFPEDLDFMQVLFACNKQDIELTNAIMFCNQNPWIKELNKQPIYTVYTCAYNAEKTIDETMRSILQQSEFNKTEYLLVDDFSTDNTPLFMASYAACWPNVKYIRNDMNIGLAASSNVALTHARGKYIMRLDADDYLIRVDAVQGLAMELESRALDAIYPGYYDGSRKVVGDPRKEHHAAGALFRTRALNHIKFTDKLRNFDGLDLYLRAKATLAIGYVLTPYFFYRHTDKSMSRTNLKQREKIKQELEARHGV